MRYEPVPANRDDTTAAPATLATVYLPPGDPRTAAIEAFSTSSLW